MKPLLVFAFLFSIFVFQPAWAEDAKTDYDKEFAAMVAQSEAMPADFDFIKIRKLYPKLSYFHPYTTDVPKDFKPLFARVEAGDKSVLPEVEAYAKKHFPLMAAHARAYTSYQKFGDEKMMAYHEWAAKGAVKAMRDTGDARSKETALPVINISEEYLIARQLGQVKEQQLVNDPKTGHSYDVLTVANPKGGEETKLWFDITEDFAHIDEDFGLDKIKGAK